MLLSLSLQRKLPLPLPLSLPLPLVLLLLQSDKLGSEPVAELGSLAPLPLSLRQRNQDIRPLRPRTAVSAARRCVHNIRARNVRTGAPIPFCRFA